jgi:hypothetical protein
MIEVARRVRKLSLVARQELDDLAGWCEFIETYLHDRILMTHELSDSEFFETSYKWKVEILQQVRVEENLRGMRMVFRDMNEELRGLSGSLRNELNSALRDRFGHGLERGDRQLARQARSILKRGKISTAEQSRILETRLSAIIDDDSSSEEVEQINALLATVKEPLPD